MHLGGVGCWVLPAASSLASTGLCLSCPSVPSLCLLQGEPFSERDAAFSEASFAQGLISYKYIHKIEEYASGSNYPPNWKSLLGERWQNLIMFPKRGHLLIQPSWHQPLSPIVLSILFWGPWVACLELAASTVFISWPPDSHHHYQYQNEPNCL